MKMRIKQWNAIAVWKWIADDDNCGICRMAFDCCCPECKVAFHLFRLFFSVSLDPVDVQVPGEECPIVWGKCSHVFHMHCILKWVQESTNQQCPMCRQPWDIKK